MAITVKQLKEKLSQIPDDWLAGAYEGEGIGLSIKSPNYEWANNNPKTVTWIETGPPS